MHPNLCLTLTFLEISNKLKSDTLSLSDFSQCTHAHTDTRIVGHMAPSTSIDTICINRNTKSELTVLKIVSGSGAERKIFILSLWRVECLNECQIKLIN